MAYRRDELLKVAHPHPEDLFAEFEKFHSQALP